ncbi:uncharacterized protein Z520_00931 [Fonsecaea multimorphosa CBS 102226]|uniref:RING-type domain-containing protein n=1 Tax=Fonsecaea multimorphosa CBS 102226 TaxID=1442371 RepID=A0A0D2J454_9EURO|nr:uncharacterized protein Z520_00931 [Fonsecaea multimorphosa CBS 102226]KIY04237.1 hypothetical protein Z520_00931 [Fonsecaea multimorphosa CBS 102226]OAL32062.1 hypothetical protein AYO22_00932 [Fonsecaea multimorphosa]
MSAGSSYHSTPFSASAIEPAPPLPPPDRSRQRPPQPLRRSSPRLFRDFFNAMSDTASRRQATLPHPALSLQDPLVDVNRALENANRALLTAQEAFYQARRPLPGNEARRLRTDSEAPSQLVDLTAQRSSSPQRSRSSISAESHYLSQTTHPHDPSSAHRSRRLHALDEPVYGARPTSSDRELPRLPPSFRFWPAGPGVYLNRQDPDYDGRLPPAFEEEAINRQRENHQNWERTQARSRHRQRVEQEQSQSQSQISSQTTMSPPSSSLRSTHQSSQHRHSPKPDAGTEDPPIESVDLTAVDDADALSAALAKQRQDAILAQNPRTESGRTSLTGYKCPVCMDTPTDATSTACGHVFCHRCILDTLKWSIETRRENMPASRKSKGVCPVCRKTLDMKDTPGPARGLIPLELKLMVRKRKREDNPDEKAPGKAKGKGKGKSLAKAETLSDDEDENRKDSVQEVPKPGHETVDEEAFWGTFIDDQA